MSCLMLTWSRIKIVSTGKPDCLFRVDSMFFSVWSGSTLVVRVLKAWEFWWSTKPAHTFRAVFPGVLQSSKNFFEKILAILTWVKRPPFTIPVETLKPRLETLTWAAYELVPKIQNTCVCSKRALGYGIPFSNLKQILRHSHFLPTAGVFESTH